MPLVWSVTSTDNIPLLDIDFNWTKIYYVFFDVEYRNIQNIEYIKHLMFYH